MVTSILQEKVEQLPVEQVAAEILVGDIRSAGIQDPEAASEIPESPAYVE